MEILLSIGMWCPLHEPAVARVICHISLAEHALHLARTQRAQTNYGSNEKSLASLAVYPVSITPSYMMVPFQPGYVRREHRSPQKIWVCPAIWSTCMLYTSKLPSSQKHWSEKFSSLCLRLRSPTFVSSVIVALSRQYIPVFWWSPTCFVCAFDAQGESHETLSPSTYMMYPQPFSGK